MPASPQDEQSLIITTSVAVSFIVLISSAILFALKLTNYLRRRKEAKRSSKARLYAWQTGPEKDSRLGAPDGRLRKGKNAFEQWEL